MIIQIIKNFLYLFSKDFLNLCMTFAYKDLKSKYSQTRFNFLLIILQPILTYFFNLLFSNLIRDEDLIPNYKIYLFLGFMTIYYISFLLIYTGQSFIQNYELIRKTNIPKLVFPFSKAIVGIIDLFFWIIFIFILMLFFKLEFRIKIFFLFFVVPLHTICGLTLGLILFLISYKHKDLYLFIPFIVSAIILITPVFYHPNLIPNNLKPFLFLNPIAGILEFYRYIFIGTAYNFSKFIYSFLFMIITFIFVIYLFQKKEKKISEYI